MEHALGKLKEAARIRADMAKQEAVFWEKIAEGLAEFSGFREMLHNPPQSSITPATPKTGYMTVKEAAEHLMISQATLNNWRLTGGGPKFVKIGRRVRYRVEDLESYTTENTFPHTSAYALKK